MGLPQGGYREGGTVARTAKVRATVVDVPAAGRPGEGTPGCGQRVTLTEGPVMAGLIPRAAALLIHYRNRILRPFFHPPPGNRCWRGRSTRLL